MIQILITAVIGLAAGFLLGFCYRKIVSEKEISSAEEEGKRIINEAIKAAEAKRAEAESRKKEAIL